MTDEPKPRTPMDGTAYWHANLRYLAVLLSVWLTVSFGCGILLADTLDQFRFMGFKLGFWFAQQGSIYVFCILIAVYVVLMNRLDRRFGVDHDGVDTPSADPPSQSRKQ